MHRALEMESKHDNVVGERLHQNQTVTHLAGREGKKSMQVLRLIGLSECFYAPLCGQVRNASQREIEQTLKSARYVIASKTVRFASLRNPVRQVLTEKASAEPETDYSHLKTPPIRDTVFDLTFTTTIIIVSLIHQRSKALPLKLNVNKHSSN
jgi:hypothetical protein